MAGKARLLALLALSTGGTALGAAAAPSVLDLAGRYTHSFRNGDISGARFTSRDEILIVPIDARRALFEIRLNFFNGHECSIGGVAAWEGGELLYHDRETTGPEGQPCRLRLWRQGRSLRWDDNQNSCKGFCGARGSLMDGAMAWSSRQPVSRARRDRLLRDHERNRTLP